MTATPVRRPDLSAVVQDDEGGRDVEQLVPEGLKEGSQAIYCLVSGQNGNRPVDTVLEVKGFWE